MKDSTSQLLDVRTSREFQAGHLPHAMQANWSDPKEFRSRTSHLDKTQPVLVYCQVGARSKEAAAFLTKSGFRVLELEGGVNAWKKNQGPMVQESPGLQMKPDEFHQKIYESGTVLVSFGGSWCPPCRTMKPVIDSLTNDPSLHFKTIQIDPGEQPLITEYLRVEVLPTYMIYREGKIRFKTEGPVTREILYAELVK